MESRLMQLERTADVKVLPAPGRSILQSAMATTTSLIDLRGVSFACVIDVETGAVMTRQERPSASAQAGPRYSQWVQAVTKIFASRAMTVQDVMFTTADTHHLLRPVPGWGALGSWIYMTMDRETGNVAVARRALATCGPAGGPTEARTSPRPTPAAVAPRRLVTVPAPSGVTPRATWTTARPVDAPPVPEPERATTAEPAAGRWWARRRRRLAVG
jgi:hypothetical protein